MVVDVTQNSACSMTRVAAQVPDVSGRRIRLNLPSATAAQAMDKIWPALHDHAFLSADSRHPPRTLFREQARADGLEKEGRQKRQSGR